MGFTESLPGTRIKKKNIRRAGNKQECSAGEDKSNIHYHPTLKKVKLDKFKKIKNLETGHTVLRDNTILPV